MADGKGSWVKLVDENLKKDLDLAALAAYENACSLNHDARLLFESFSYSRATALAILAEEEFCKAFTLKLSANNERWDSNIFKSLHNHAIKQGLAEAVVSYIEWEKMSVGLFDGLAIGKYPDENKVKEVVNKAKERLSKPVKDHLKQDALYISISKDGKLKSQPKDFTKEEAERNLLFTDSFQIMVAVLFGDEITHEAFFKT